jgi:hypothetical protein
MRIKNGPRQCQQAWPICISPNGSAKESNFYTFASVSAFFSPARASSPFVYTRVPKSRVCHCRRRIHKNTSLSLSGNIDSSGACLLSLTRSPTRPTESFVSSFAAAGAALSFLRDVFIALSQPLPERKMYMLRINIALNTQEWKKKRKVKFLRLWSRISLLSTHSRKKRLESEFLWKYLPPFNANSLDGVILLVKIHLSKMTDIK